MPKLKCEVSECSYNADHLCARGGIDVEGPEARCKKDTACLSFVPKGRGSYNYEFAKFEETFKPETSVYCDAVNCVFECDSRCRADRIEIKKTADGDQAKNAATTMCKTFESKDV